MVHSVDVFCDRFQLQSSSPVFHHIMSSLPFSNEGDNADYGVIPTDGIAVRRLVSIEINKFVNF